MDGILAAKMESELRGKILGKWTIQKLVNNGKSAAVFEATDDTGQLAAIKFFDKDIVQRAGKQKQLERIDREKKLVGKAHEHLVKIYDGGEWEEEDLLYVIMECLPYKNLHELSKGVLPGHIPNIIRQIALACQFLEEVGLAHRDIKTENIAISDDFSKAVLLDLGVLHPLDLGDQYEQNSDFVATLQYSPPELLLRNEKDNMDGWRAISFYQIGAVIFELLTKKTLFEEESHPFARLVNAVQYSIPKIAGNYPRELVNLALMSLNKCPKKRTAYLNWDSFTDIIKKKATRTDVQLAMSLRPNTLVSVVPHEQKAKLAKFSDHVVHVIKAICTSDFSCFPPHKTNTTMGIDSCKCAVNVQFRGISEEISFTVEPVDITSELFSVLCNNVLVYEGGENPTAMSPALEDIILDHLHNELAGSGV